MKSLIKGLLNQENQKGECDTIGLISGDTAPVSKMKGSWRNTHRSRHTCTLSHRWSMCRGLPDRSCDLWSGDTTACGCHERERINTPAWLFSLYSVYFPLATLNQSQGTLTPDGGSSYRLTTQSTSRLGESGGQI